MPKRKGMMGDEDMGSLKKPPGAAAAKVKLPKMSAAKVKMVKPRLGKRKRG
jgi:hypothetical protein